MDNHIYLTPTFRYLDIRHRQGDGVLCASKVPTVDIADVVEDNTDNTFFE